MAEKAKEKHRKEQEKMKQEKGISLGAEDLEEYNRLCVLSTFLSVHHELIGWM